MRVPYSNRSVRPFVRPSSKKAMVKSILHKLGVTHSPNLHQLMSWHVLLMPRGGLCPWPTFHTWVTGKKETVKSILQYLWVLHLPNDQLMPRGGLCPWPTFYAWVTMVRKKCLYPYYSTNYGSYIHQTNTNCSSWHVQLMVVCVLDLHLGLYWPWLGRDG